MIGSNTLSILDTISDHVISAILMTAAPRIGSLGLSLVAQAAAENRQPPGEQPERREPAGQKIDQMQPFVALPFGSGVK